MANGKRVAVTGALGKIGKVLVPYLRDKSYEVFLIDDIAPSDPKESAIRADLTDFGQALDALSSIGADTYARAEPKAFDAIVHLASMPHPRMKPDAEELRINMMVTYNVFESARRLGIKNVIWSASEVATGIPYDKTAAPYVPVDESYPMRGYNVYSLTKVLGEEMARQFCLNDPEMRITCLRLSNVMNPEEYEGFEEWQDDSAKRLWNFWTYIDNRDVAQAVALAIEHDVRGKDEFFITNDETVMRTPTTELLDKHFPNIERRKAFSGNEAVISNEKAKRVLGYQPQHRWTDKK